MGRFKLFTLAIHQAYLIINGSGDCVNPLNALGTPNGVWAGEINANTSFTHEWQFNTLDNLGNPTAYDQVIQIYCRAGSNSGVPEVTRVRVRQGTTYHLDDTTVKTVTSTTGQTLTYTIPAGTILNGTNAWLLEVTVAGVSGSPSKRNSIQIDYAVFNYEYAPTETVSITPNTAEAAEFTDGFPIVEFTGDSLNG